MSAEIDNHRPENLPSNPSTSRLAHIGSRNYSKARQTRTPTAVTNDDPASEGDIDQNSLDNSNHPAVQTQGEFESILGKEEQNAGLTLDKILGTTFQQIDLNTIKDFSNELFPSKPMLAYQRSRTNPRRREEADESAMMTEELLANPRAGKDMNTTTDVHPRDFVNMDLRESSINMNRSLAGTLKGGRKESQNSIVFDKKDVEMIEAMTKSTAIPMEKISQESRSRINIRVKGRVLENSSYSPTPINTKNKFISMKRRVVQKTEELLSLSQIRSIDYSGERKKTKPLNSLIRKPDYGPRDVSFGIEGKSIDWSGKRLGHKNSIQLDGNNKPFERHNGIFKTVGMEESFGRGNVKILHMLREGNIGYHDTRVPSRSGKQHNIDNEQWELFQKYGNKFGIKPQEYFGITGTGGMLDGKASMLRQQKVGKSPTPLINKKSYGEIDPYRVKIPNKNIFREVPVKAVL